MDKPRYSLRKSVLFCYGEGAYVASLFGGIQWNGDEGCEIMNTLLEAQGFAGRAYALSEAVLRHDLEMLKIAELRRMS